MTRTAVTLFALLAIAAPAQAQDAPAPQAAPQTAAQADPLPRGAPEDDYEFVGWCTGALSTHIELYTRVKGELDAISIRWNTAEEDARLYADQQRSGRATMALFDRAMRAAEAASPRNLAPVGRNAIQSGVAMWADLSRVDARNQAYSWMNWELPERCVRVAQRLEANASAAGSIFRNTGATSVSASSAPILDDADRAAPIMNPDAPLTTAPTPSPFDPVGGRLRQ